jgi:hypothetical protein
VFAHSVQDQFQLTNPRHRHLHRDSFRHHQQQQLNIQLWEVFEQAIDIPEQPVQLA